MLVTNILILVTDRQQRGKLWNESEVVAAAERVYTVQYVKLLCRGGRVILTPVIIHSSQRTGVR